jgi:hypothetical protein
MSKKKDANYRDHVNSDPTETVKVGSDSLSSCHLPDNVERVLA